MALPPRNSLDDASDAQDSARLLEQVASAISRDHIAAFERMGSPFDHDLSAIDRMSSRFASDAFAQISTVSAAARMASSISRDHLAAFGCMGSLFGRDRLMETERMSSRFASDAFAQISTVSAAARMASSISRDPLAAFGCMGSLFGRDRLMETERMSDAFAQIERSTASTAARMASSINRDHLAAFGCMGSLFGRDRLMETERMSSAFASGHLPDVERATSRFESDYLAEIERAESMSRRYLAELEPVDPIARHSHLLEIEPARSPPRHDSVADRFASSCRREFAPIEHVAPRPFVEPIRDEPSSLGDAVTPAPTPPRTINLRFRSFSFMEQTLVKEQLHAENASPTGCECNPCNLTVWKSRKDLENDEQLLTITFACECGALHERLRWKALRDAARGLVLIPAPQE